MSHHLESYPKLDLPWLKEHWPPGLPIQLIVWRRGSGEQRQGHAFLEWQSDHALAVDWHTFRSPRLNISGGRACLSMAPYVENHHYRLFWQCPVCEKARKSLFLKDDYWACRHCHQLVYRSQRLDMLSRKQEELEALERTVGCGRPKGMHHSTFDFKIDRLNEITVYLAKSRPLVVSSDLVELTMDLFNPGSLPGLKRAAAYGIPSAPWEQGQDNGFDDSYDPSCINGRPD